MKTAQSGSIAGRVTSLVLGMGFLGLFAVEAQAQVDFAVEGRVGVTLPTRDISDQGAESGLSVGGELQANFRPDLSAYAGLYRYAFSCDNSCGLGDSPRSSGLALGLKYIFHNPGDVLVWGRGGIVANKFSADNGSSDRKIGFELGAGADIPIATRLFLVPSVALISHKGGGEFTARFLTFGVGAHYHIH